MLAGNRIRLLFATLPVLLTGLWAQRPFREYIPMEGRDSEAALPPDYRNPAELVLGRLMYPSGGGFGRGGGNWQDGGTNWTVDYPRGDRTFAVAIRRLTRIDVRSVEQPVNPDDGDEIFYWPYLHVGMPTNWNLTHGPGRQDPRVPSARRLHALRQLLRHPRMGRLPRRHARHLPRPPDRRPARRKTPSFTPPTT